MSVTMMTTDAIKQKGGFRYTVASVPTLVKGIRFREQWCGVVRKLETNTLYFLDLQEDPESAWDALERYVIVCVNQQKKNRNDEQRELPL